MIVIERWAGLVTNASPYALPPGAAVTQVNVQVISPGRAAVRDGVSQLSWSTHSASTSPVISIHRVHSGTTETALIQDAAGQIYVARGPL